MNFHPSLSVTQTKNKARVANDFRFREALSSVPCLVQLNVNHSAGLAFSYLCSAPGAEIKRHIRTTAIMDDNTKLTVLF